ncbi:MAG: hypothetical protein KatS3mg124_0665 [Porticoccaceae bacterium]|nr:MAG: hypothetical protein KatS3mg124_0665 [Porticoccaceae bacterium]
MVRGRALLGAVLLALSAAAAGAGVERDPHEASGGFTRTSGPYRVPGGPPRLADEHPWWAVWGERFEYQPDREVLTWDLEASWGGTWRRLVARAEGHRVDGTAEESAGELLWARALDPYFDLRAGVRREWLAEGPERTWFALGVAGLAPYWFHLDATAYLGDGGRSALNLHATYDLLFSQRLVLEPRVELWIYGEDDPRQRPRQRAVGPAARLAPALGGEPPVRPLPRGGVAPAARRWCRFRPRRRGRGLPGRVARRGALLVLSREASWGLAGDGVRPGGPRTHLSLERSPDGV